MSSQDAVLHSLLSIAGHGDHIVSSATHLHEDALSRGLPQHGIGVTFVEPLAANFASAIRRTTKAIYADAGADIRAVAALARGYGIPLILT